MSVISAAVASVLIALLSVLAALPVDRDAAPRERRQVPRPGPEALKSVVQLALVVPVPGVLPLGQ